MSAASAQGYVPESWWFTGKFASLLAVEHGQRLGFEGPARLTFVGLPVATDTAPDARILVPTSYLVARQMGRGLYMPLACDWLIEP